MREYNTISDNEWLIMEILWRDGRTKSSTIEAELKTNKDWANPTVRTFLKRLMTKGIVTADQDAKDKRVYWYYPAISKEEYIASQTQGHLNRYYSGRLPQLVAGLLKEESVSDQELNEIENLLRRHASKKEE